jgi:hypothetical protein
VADAGPTATRPETRIVARASFNMEASYQLDDGRLGRRR